MMQFQIAKINSFHDYSCTIRNAAGSQKHPGRIQKKTQTLVRLGGRLFGSSLLAFYAYCTRNSEPQL